jgi:hypothetical protein
MCLKHFNDSCFARTRNKFQPDEDYEIFVLFWGQEQSGAKTGGNAVFKQFEYRFPGHTWHSVRDRYNKQLRNQLETLSPAEFTEHLRREKNRYLEELTRQNQMPEPTGAARPAVASGSQQRQIEPVRHEPDVEKEPRPVRPARQASPQLDDDEIALEEDDLVTLNFVHNQARMAAPLRTPDLVHERAASAIDRPYRSPVRSADLDLGRVSSSLPARIPTRTRSPDRGSMGSPVRYGAKRQLSPDYADVPSSSAPRAISVAVHTSPMRASPEPKRVHVESPPRRSPAKSDRSLVIVEQENQAPQEMMAKYEQLKALDSSDDFKERVANLADDLKMKHVAVLQALYMTSGSWSATRLLLEKCHLEGRTRLDLNVCDRTLYFSLYDDYLITRDLLTTNEDGMEHSDDEGGNRRVPSYYFQNAATDPEDSLEHQYSDAKAMARVRGDKAVSRRARFLKKAEQAKERRIRKYFLEEGI